MTTRRPPLRAARLLGCLLPTQDHSAIVGDLHEEYQRGRSRLRYVGQVLAAIVVGSWKDLRNHPIVAARAVVTGLIARAMLIVAILTLQNALTGAGFMWRGMWIGLPWYWHWPYASSLWMILAVTEMVGDVAIGWLIVRLHRGHGVTMVLACCAGFAALSFASLLRIALLGWWGTPHFLDLSYGVVGGHIRLSLLMLVGGYLAARRLEAAGLETSWD